MKHRRVGAVGVLLDHGADLEIADRKGNTVLDIAVARGEESVVEMLRDWNNGMLSSKSLSRVEFGQDHAMMQSIDACGMLALSILLV